MTKDGVLVDTSVVIDFIKGKEPVTSKFEELLLKGRIILNGIVLAELLQGVKNQKEEYKVLVLSEATDVFEIPVSVWIKAGKLSSSLRRKGINLPLTDVAIAALAIEHNLQVFTSDKHFKKIPGVKLYKL
jgi:hypothetical protein